MWSFLWSIQFLWTLGKGSLFQKKKNINKNKKRKKKVWDLFCTIMDVIDANIIFWEIGMLCVKFYWRKTTLIDLRTKNYKGMNELDLYTQ